MTGIPGPGVRSNSYHDTFQLSTLHLGFWWIRYAGPCHRQNSAARFSLRSVTQPTKLRSLQIRAHFEIFASQQLESKKKNSCLLHVLRWHVHWKTPKTNRHGKTAISSVTTGHVGPLCSTPARSRSLELQVIGVLLPPAAPWNYPAWFLHLKGVPGWKRTYIKYKATILGSSMWVFWGVGQLSRSFLQSRFFFKRPSMPPKFGRRDEGFPVSRYILWHKNT